MWAVKESRCECIETLVANGADMDVKDKVLTGSSEYMAFAAGLCFSFHSIFFQQPSPVLKRGRCDPLGKRGREGNYTIVCKIMVSQVKWSCG